jgi:zinc protease
VIAAAEGRAQGDARVVRADLPGGAHILVVRDPTAPVVTARAVWPGGMRLEREASAGLTRLMADSWVAGCGQRGASEVAYALERTAGSMWGIAGRDSVELAAEWPVSSWRAGLALMADCALAPRFAATAVDRARRNLLAERAARDRSAGERAWQLLVATLHEGGAYAADPLGTESSLEAIDARAVAAHFAAAYPGGAMAVAVVGDVDPDQVVAAARKAFASAKSGPRPVGGPQRTTASAAGERQVFGFLPGEVSAVAVGFRGVPIAHPDRAGLDVLAEVLAARVGAKLRLDQRLVHRASAMSIEGVESGFVAVEIACRADRTSAAVAALRAEIDRLRTAGPTQDEITRALRALRRPDPHPASALASDEALGTAAAARARRAAFPRLRAADLAALAARTFTWDAAVIATVMPPRASPEAARRARGSVRRAIKRRPRR